MRFMRSLPLALLGSAWLLAACDMAREPAPQALLTVDVGPRPLQAPLTCPAPPPSTLPCILSLTPTVTITETGGVGARLQAVDVSLTNLASSEKFEYTLTGDAVKAQTGTDRIEARQTLVFQIRIAYPVPCCSSPRLSAVFGFRFQDDRGNALTQDILLAIG